MAVAGVARRLLTSRIAPTARANDVLRASETGSRGQLQPWKLKSSCFIDSGVAGVQKRHRSTEAAPLASCSTEVLSLSVKSETLEVRWGDSSSSSSSSSPSVDEYPFVWLRDNCQCPQCFHPVSKARTTNMVDLDVDVKAAKAEFCANTNKVLVTWADGHVSPFDPDWLRDRSFGHEHRTKWHKLAKREPPIYFDAKDPIRRHSYKQVMEDDRKLYDWLNDLERVGMTMVYGLGSDNLKDLAARVAFTKATHYGHFFEVKTKGDPNNLAYTPSTLGLHLDEPHYLYTPGIQFLHCIHQWEMEGGDNEFADGFKVANDMRRKHPKEFELLSSIPVYFWDVGVDDISGEFNKIKESTTFRLNSDGEVCQISMSNHHRDSYISAPMELVKPWYAALKLYTEMSYSEDNLVKYKMKSGDCSVFDNLRVLHGRKGYRLVEGGFRHLQGCYIDWDEAYSRINVLKEKFHGKARQY